MKNLSYPGELSLSILNQTKASGINFRVDTFFDPYGDGKSERKLLNRKFYYSFKTYKEIIDRFHTTKYYSTELIFSMKKYKKSIQF